MSKNETYRRSRKSAPIKNAIFVGAANKERRRLCDIQNENTCESSSNDHKQVKNADLNNRNSENKSSRKSRRHLRECNDDIPKRMSTPLGRDRSSLRPTPSKAHNESTHSLMNLPNVINRRFHPKYDPYIEIRRARERLEQYRTKGDWASDMLLSDDADEDLHRYEDKLKRRYSTRGEPNNDIELERRQLELLRRQRDIDRGKVTDKYAEYVLTIPKPEREKNHPRTPNKFRTVSRRAWDGMIKKWRKHLHFINDPDFNETWRSLATDLSISSFSSNASQTDNSISSSDDGNEYKHKIGVSYKDEKEKNNQYRVPVKTEDEDTLQAMVKPVITSIYEEEEDTMHANDQNKKNKENNYGPSPDILHSGLTNDMTSLAKKVPDFGDLIEMLSPKKRPRKNLDQ